MSVVSDAVTINEDLPPLKTRGAPSRSAWAQQRRQGPREVLDPSRGRHLAETVAPIADRVYIEFGMLHSQPDISPVQRRHGERPERSLSPPRPVAADVVARHESRSMTLRASLRRSAVRDRESSRMFMPGLVER